MKRLQINTFTKYKDYVKNKNKILIKFHPDKPSGNQKVFMFHKETFDNYFYNERIFYRNKKKLISTGSLPESDLL